MAAKMWRTFFMAHDDMAVLESTVKLIKFAWWMNHTRELKGSEKQFPRPVNVRLKSEYKAQEYISHKEWTPTSNNAHWCCRASRFRYSLNALKVIHSNVCPNFTERLMWTNRRTWMEEITFYDLHLHRSVLMMMINNLNRNVLWPP